METPFWQKLFASIADENTYILLFAVLVAICLILILVLKKSVLRGQGREQYRWLRVLYEFFLTGITVFPLLGMFGTVKALLSLDFVNDLAGAQLRFFDALTSTAWGIIFAVIFKLLNALIASDMERLIEQQERRLRHRPKDAQQ